MQAINVCKKGLKVTSGCSFRELPLGLSQVLITLCVCPGGGGLCWVLCCLQCDGCVESSAAAAAGIGGTAATNILPTTRQLARPAGVYLWRLDTPNIRMQLTHGMSHTDSS